MLSAVTVLSLGAGVVMVQGEMLEFPAEGVYFSQQHQTATQTTNNESSTGCNLARPT